MELLQNQEEGYVCFSFILEFLFIYFVLSFGIQVVSCCWLWYIEVLFVEEENDSLGVDGIYGVGVMEFVVGVFIKFFCVYIKVL